ncbi:hypothetical protein GIB67_019154 [Kingdonia uniflora]|uniref:NADH:ubiquinone reductase (non-electrogenic) n=1 Tax=Kingdonia uniflora TaxID=39325 RepID=A0A7J7MZM5_9MAGN|nr:hypothetical protein GIB67_019154 [Kingdonia uniflora]
MLSKGSSYGLVYVLLDVIASIEQTSFCYERRNRRVLGTDEWFASCYSILSLDNYDDIAVIFSKADEDKSGTLTIKKFQDVLHDICLRYPQMELYLKNNRMKNIVDLLTDPKAKVIKESIELDIEAFKSTLSQVDSQMKNLPATAQVAAQQGSYLANCFNCMKEYEENPEGPLRFRGIGRHRFLPFSLKVQRLPDHNTKGYKSIMPKTWPRKDYRSIHVGCLKPNEVRSVREHGAIMGLSMEGFL